MATSELEEIFNLLRLYEGVAIEDWGISSEKEIGVLHLRILEPKSITRLLYFCTAVNNIDVNVYAESRSMDTDSMEDSLKRLVWTFVFREFKDGRVPKELRYFAIRMVWDLGKRGILNETEYVRLLALWKGFNWMKEERLRDKASKRNADNQ